ncbi:MAG: alpha/beta hydrolase [Rubrivivax sp.]|nr:alpha/beta hydrolase [Rubrivivax sp.]
MERAANLLAAFLSRDGAGLVIALAVAAAGLAAWHASGGAVAGKAAGGVLMLAGAVLAAGALRHLVVVAQVARRHPPPGRMVDAGGFKVHVFAEGTAAEGRAAVVWFGGGHASGLTMLPFHRALKADTRSILIDRPGTAWSDSGPFPRTTAGEAEECWRALDAAGERGPFLFVGHSFGGLLAANMARRRPAQTAGLVLLDATPPDTIIFGPRLGVLKVMRRGAWLDGALRLVGVHQGPFERTQRKKAPQVFEQMKRALGDEAYAAEQALQVRSGVMLATASIFAELHPLGMAARGWETVVYEGDLGDMPVWLVAPGDAQDVEQLAEMQGAGQREAERIRRFFARTRERYLTISSRAVRVTAPQGTSHNFPYEVPELVIGLVREAVGTVRRAG